jgi:hypothetical protein
MRVALFVVFLSVLTTVGSGDHNYHTTITIFELLFGGIRWARPILARLQARP